MVTECLQRKNHKIVVTNSSQAKSKTSAQLEAHVQAEALDQIIALYDVEHKLLVELNLSFILAIKSMLGIDTEVVVDAEVSGKGSELLINICKKYGSDEYLAGVGGRHYMNEDYQDNIGKNGIKHSFVERNVTAEFPYSSIHYLFEVGLDEVRSIVAGAS